MCNLIKSLVVVRMDYVYHLAPHPATWQAIDWTREEDLIKVSS